MLTPEESAELRALQRRAYAPGAHLSAADAGRLRELETLRVHAPQLESVVAEPTHDREPAVTADPVTDLFEDEVADGGDASSVDAGIGSQDVRPRRRGHWLRYAVPAVALLVGLGVGALLSGGAAFDGIRSLAHADELAELQADDTFDPASVVFVGEQDGVTLWQAEQRDSDLVCAILKAHEQSQHECMTAEQLAQWGGLSAQLLLEPDEDGAQAMISGTVARTTEGERVAIIQRHEQWTTEYNWEDAFTEDELELAKRIAEATGVAPETLGILGYDGAQSIWYGYDGVNLCVAVPQAEEVVWNCDDTTTTVVEVSDAEGRGLQYSVNTQGPTGPVLTIDWRAGESPDAE